MNVGKLLSGLGGAPAMALAHGKPQYLGMLGGMGGMAATGMLDEEMLKKLGLLGGMAGGAATGAIGPRTFGLFGGLPGMGMTR